MATATTTQAGHVVEVTYDSTGDDWDYLDATGFGVGMRTRAIIWLPSAADDQLIINEGGVDGPSIVDWTAGGVSDTKQIAFGSRGVALKPYIDLTDCTFTTTGSIKVIFILA